MEKDVIGEKFFSENKNKSDRYTDLFRDMNNRNAETISLDNLGEIEDIIMGIDNIVESHDALYVDMSNIFAPLIHTGLKKGPYVIDIEDINTPDHEYRKFSYFFDFLDQEISSTDRESTISFSVIIYIGTSIDRIEMTRICNAQSKSSNMINGVKQKSIVEDVGDMTIPQYEFLKKFLGDARDDFSYVYN